MEYYKFQYILCVGSRLLVIIICTLLQCFNTSYVSVQGCVVLIGFFFSFVSIHPMCRFKGISDTIQSILSRFNTSYVSVQVND